MAVLYRRVYESLREDILSGRYPVGERLPSEAELSATFSVSAITIKKALDLLRTDGLILRRPRLGTVVISSSPNPAPSPVPAGAPPLIGCVLTSFDDTFGTRVIEGVLAAAGDEAQVVLKRSEGDLEREDAAIRAVVDAGASGLVLLPSSSEFIPPAALELVTRKFPVVILDRLFDGIPVSAVGSDNLVAGRLATQHLVDLGHQVVGFVSSASHVSSIEDRRSGYVHAHALAHLPLTNRAEYRELGSTVPGSTVTIEEDVAGLMTFLGDHPDITGFVAAEYNIALLLREACRRLGRTVPDDVSIVCIDHPDAAFDFGLFRFTHIRQAQHDLGARAVEAVLAQLRDGAAVEKLQLPVELVEGGSDQSPSAAQLSSRARCSTAMIALSIVE
jgi:DNA-binding LacI/PurR family transcriptional regulator